MRITLIIIFMSTILSSLFGTNVNYEILNNEEFAKVITDKTVQLVDVRTPDEFNEVHIPGAVNIDVKNSDFPVEAEKLDKERPVAVYCRSGARSKIAAKILADKGYKVYDLDKGIMNWDGAKVTP